MKINMKAHASALMSGVGLCSILGVSLFGATALGSGAASEAGASPIYVTEIAGKVDVTMAGAAQRVRVDSVLGLPARILTGDDGRIDLRQSKTTVSIAPDSDIEIPEDAGSGHLVAKLIQRKGNAFYDVEPRPLHKLRIETPYLVAVVKGTQFNVTVQQGSTTISLFRGLLEIHTPDNGQTIALRAGEIAIRSLVDPSIRVLSMDQAAPLAAAPAGVQDRAAARRYPEASSGASAGQNGSSEPGAGRARAAPGSRSTEGPAKASDSDTAPVAFSDPSRAGVSNHGRAAASLDSPAASLDSPAASLDSRTASLDSPAAASVDSRGAVSLDGRAVARPGLAVATGRGGVSGGIGHGVPAGIGHGVSGLGEGTPPGLGRGVSALGASVPGEPGGAAIGLGEGISLSPSASTVSLGSSDAPGKSGSAIDLGASVLHANGRGPSSVDVGNRGNGLHVPALAAGLDEDGAASGNGAASNGVGAVNAGLHAGASLHTATSDDDGLHTAGNGADLGIGPDGVHISLGGLHLGHEHGEGGQGPSAGTGRGTQDVAGK